MARAKTGLDVTERTVGSMYIGLDLPFIYSFRHSAMEQTRGLCLPQHSYKTLGHPWLADNPIGN